MTIRRFRLSGRPARFVSRLLLTLLALSAPGVIASARGGVAPLDVLLSTESVVPGVEAGARFNGFDAPAINNLGNIAFVGLLTNTTGTRSGLWLGRPGNWSLILREGQTPPGNLGTVGPMRGMAFVLNNADQLAFNAPVGSGTAIYRATRTGLTLIAASGRQAPGLPPGVLFRELGDPVMNASGQIAFQAALVGPGITQANGGSLWLFDGSTLRVVIKGGDSLIITQPTTTVRSLGPPILNDSGRLAFAGLVQGPNVDPYKDSARWVTSQATPILQLFAGALVFTPSSPDAPEGKSYLIRRVLPGLHRMNAAGSVVHFTDHDDWFAPSKFRHGLWLSTTSSTRPIALPDMAPALGGLPSTFITYSSVAIDPIGQVHFKASVAGQGLAPEVDHGIFTVDTAGAIRTRLMTGLIAPGISGLPRLGEISPHFAVGTSGQLYLAAPFGTPIPGVRYNRVLMLSYPSGDLCKILATGDSITINNLPRTVTAITNFFAGTNQDGQASAINSTNAFVFRVGLADGSWALVRHQMRNACRGDFNGDRLVDAADFSLFAEYYQSALPSPGDFNGDGITDNSDFQQFAGAYFAAVCP